ncbi:MAG: ATP synthase F1 subunit delta [Candidatus Omnitrophica bacterium]|nr:ATP synthase F1 subunit delta [Candidatus Omnitrophota bacterium]
MSDVIAAGRYTRALFQLAEKEGCLAEVDAGLHALAKILAAQPKVLRLIANPTLTNREKYGLALGTLAGEKTGLLGRFLHLLIDKKRFALLPEVQKIFHDSFEKKQGVQEVEMVSAVPLSSGFLEKLKDVLTQRLRTSPLAKGSEARTTIRLIPKTDRTLLGGFILRFAGKEIDCSFRNHLHEIRQKLLMEPVLS